MLNILEAAWSLRSGDLSSVLNPFTAHLQFFRFPTKALRKLNMLKKMPTKDYNQEAFNKKNSFPDLFLFIKKNYQNKTWL